MSRLQGSRHAALADASHVALDNQQAELTLLQASLAKSKAVTEKATTSLNALDDRLARLEKSVLGIHGSTSGLTRVNRNIANVLAAIDRLLANHDVAEEHEAVVARGPRTNDLATYQASIDKLVQALEELKRTGTGSSTAMGKAPELDETAGRISRAIESGARQLGAVFLGWVREASEAGSSSIPQQTLTRISSLLNYIRNLPSAGSAVEKDLQRSYGEVRGSYMANTLEAMGKEVVESSRNVASAGGRTFGDLLRKLFAMAQSEHALAGTVFPSFAANYVYRAIVPPALTVMFTYGQNLNAIVKRNLSSTIGIAWRCFADLQAHTEIFDDWIRAKASRKDNELGELLHAFRGSCLRSLPEFIEDTKAWGIKAPAANDHAAASVGDMTYNVVAFMTELTAHESIAETFLQTLGDGNWHMGGQPPSGTVRGHGGSVLEKYLSDVLATLFNALEARARILRQRSTATASIFVLNNVAYCRREVTSGSVSDVLGEAVEDDLNRRMRGAKAAYLEVFSPLVSCLMEAAHDPGLLAGALKSGQQTAAADRERRLARFADSLSDIEGVHRYARIDPGESELRERVRDEVERMVIPTYSKFVSRPAPAAAPGKTRALDVAVVQDRLHALFQ